MSLIDIMIRTEFDQFPANEQSKHLKGHLAPRVSDIMFFNQALWATVIRSFGAPRE